MHKLCCIHGFLWQQACDGMGVNGRCNIATHDFCGKIDPHFRKAIMAHNMYGGKFKTVKTTWNPDSCTVLIAVTYKSFNLVLLIPPEKNKLPNIIFHFLINPLTMNTSAWFASFRLLPRSPKSSLPMMESGVWSKWRDYLIAIASNDMPQRVSSYGKVSAFFFREDCLTVLTVRVCLF